MKLIEDLIESLTHRISMTRYCTAPFEYGATSITRGHKTNSNCDSIKLLLDINLLFA